MTTFEHSPWDIDRSLPHDDPCWYNFFHAYASSKPSALKNVGFHPKRTNIDPDVLSTEALQVYKSQWKEPRVFPYAGQDMYGLPTNAEDQNAIALRRGHDMQGWEELMAVVRENREKDLR